LVGELDKIVGKRLLIIDDNTFSGETLYDLREMCEHYSRKTGNAAIERRTHVQEERVIELRDLDITPISKLRYIGRVLDFVEHNNLYGMI